MRYTAEHPPAPKPTLPVARHCWDGLQATPRHPEPGSHPPRRRPSLPRTAGRGRQWLTNGASFTALVMIARAIILINHNCYYEVL